jgi:hypothetical protein
MSIACFIRYQIDPHQRDAFRAYADAWAPVIPRCGGHLVGYFLPHEGTNDVAWGIVAFESLEDGRPHVPPCYQHGGLAAYEAYRARLRTDDDARRNFERAQSARFILREERTFLEVVGSTFGLPAMKVTS